MLHPGLSQLRVWPTTKGRRRYFVSSISQQSGTLVIIGKILKPFGVKGEVRVESMTDVPGRFEQLEDVTLELSNGQLVNTMVKSVRATGQGYLIAFSAFDNPEEAEAFRGSWIKVPVHPNLPREKDVYYQFELIGLEVQDPEGTNLGNVEEVLEYPQHHVFVVRGGAHELLIPATKNTIHQVDIDHNILRLHPRERWDVSHAL